MLRRLSTFLLLLVALGLLAQSGYARAKVDSPQVSLPRPAGWIVGDIIPVKIDIATSGMSLHRSGLPQPGPINYWLDLRSVDIEERSEAGQQHYQIIMNYQSFYVPLDVNTREIPGFDLVFGEGQESETVRIEPQHFTMSPLRPVASPGVSVEEQIRSDAPVMLIPTKRLMQASIALACLIVILALILAMHYAVWPFHKRRARPLAQSARRVQKRLRSNDAAAYRDAMVELHRGLDTTNGQRLLASDVPDFVHRHPEFESTQTQILNFFKASGFWFFAGSEDEARKTLSPDDLTRFARQLAAAERSKP